MAAAGNTPAPAGAHPNPDADTHVNTRADANTRANANTHADADANNHFDADADPAPTPVPSPASAPRSAPASAPASDPSSTPNRSDQPAHPDQPTLSDPSDPSDQSDQPDRHTYHAPGRRVVIWRHGQTEWNVEGRFQGQTDVPLDAVGRDQARRAARLLAALNPHSITSSDLSRTAETARELSLLTGLPVELDAGLRETYAGTWQGLTDEEIKAKFPDEFAAWKHDHSVRRGGGELEIEVADRVVPAILNALERVPPRGTLVVVSHGGSSRVAIGRLLGLPPTHWSSLGGLSNCCWSVLGEVTRGWRLLEHNAGSLPEPVIGDDASAES